MSRLSLAIASFVVGAGCMLLLGNYTSTLAQSTSAPASSGRPIFKGMHTKGNSHSGSFVQGAVPSFVSIEQTPIFEDSSFEDEPQVLDGLDCRNCEFTNVTFLYDGGPFNLINARFSGVIKIVLGGSAANTLSVLPLVQAIASGQIGAPPPNPNAPATKTAKTTKPFTLDWRTPFLQPTALRR